LEENPGISLQGNEYPCLVDTRSSIAVKEPAKRPASGAGVSCILCGQPWGHPSPMKLFSKGNHKAMTLYRQLLCWSVQTKVTLTYAFVWTYRGEGRTAVNKTTGGLLPPCRNRLWVTCKKTDLSGVPCTQAELWHYSITAALKDL